MPGKESNPPPRLPLVEAYQSLGNRDTQQDRFVIAHTNNGILVAVADGHNGSRTASIIEECLLYTFQIEIGFLEKKHSNTSSFLPEEKIGLALQNTIDSILDQTKNESSGSTLTMAFIEVIEQSLEARYDEKLRITVGQLGDSFFALLDDEEVKIAPIHSVELATLDVEEIEKEYCGLYGRDCRKTSSHIYSHKTGLNALAVTRAAGDRDFVLVRRPIIKSYEIRLNDAVAIIATDGLVDLKLEHESVLKKYLFQIKKGISAANLGVSIVQKNDNTTLLVVRSE